jgi:cytochrome P450
VTPLPPGPPLPRALQTFAWVNRPGPFLQGARERYGDTFTIKIGYEPTWVIVSHPDAVREVFTADPSLLHAGEANVILRPVVGSRSVLLLDEAPHLRQRRLLLPPFHGDRMKAYGELIDEIARREVARWPRGRGFPLHERMQDVTLEVVLHAIFGVRDARRLGELRDALQRAMDGTTRGLGVLAMVALGPGGVERWGAFRRYLGPVDDLLYAEIRSRREEPDLEARDDILSLLVQARHEDGEPMSDEELRDELMTLLVAGHETTATALAWAVERMVRTEGVDGWERLAADDAYADAVVAETLRLRPVLPVVVRRATKDVEIAGVTIPKGVIVAPCIWLMHHREDIYPEPFSFRPERFLDTKPGTYTWIPFGGGVRRCLGASFALFEMRIVLQAIARTVSLRAEDPAPERTARRAITLIPARGARVIAA